LRPIASQPNTSFYASATFVVRFMRVTAQRKAMASGKIHECHLNHPELRNRMTFYYGQTDAGVL
jgi:hypothetical protein